MFEWLKKLEEIVVVALGHRALHGWAALVYLGGCAGMDKALVQAVLAAIYLAMFVGD